MGCQRCLPCARRGFLTGWRESEAIQTGKSIEKERKRYVFPAGLSEIRFVKKLFT